MAPDDSRELFERELRRLYGVEQELAELRADLVEGTVDDEAAIHAACREAAEARLERLERVFDALDATPEAGESPALSGLLAERGALAAAAPADLRPTVDAEVGRAVERLGVAKLETLTVLANRLKLGAAVTEPLAAARDEAAPPVRESRERSR